MTAASLRLLDLVGRAPPRAWVESSGIPWSDPDFSRRMLQEHLRQDHDMASRRLATIDRHVAFLHERVMDATPGRVLDLGCGPGLYAQRLARLGYRVRGIDFSPASIEYGRQQAKAAGLAIDYVLGDLRAVDFAPDPEHSGRPCYNLVMLIFGEFSVFAPQDARRILEKARSVLLPEDGRLVLEPSTDKAVRRMGSQPPTWHTAAKGLFSDQPYLALHEAAWDEAARTATDRYTIIDAATGAATSYTSSYQAYTQTELRVLLEECGFENVRFYPSLTGDADPGGEFWAVIADRR